MYFDVPTNRSVVIKNGIDKITAAPPYQKGQPIELFIKTLLGEVYLYY